MKIRNVVVLFFILHFVNFTSLSQTDFDIILQKELYTPSRDIINGTSWSNSMVYKGHPYCGSSQWKTGDVVFNGERYSDLNINYNIVEDELILFDEKKGNEKYIKLNKRLIEKFSYFDDSEKTTKSFIHKELVLSKGKEFFEEVYSGTTSFYIKHKKLIKKQIGGTYMGSLYSDNTFYIVDSAGVHSFRNKGRLFDILGYNKELKKFIKKENLQINKDHPKDIVKLLMYYEILTQTI